MHHSRSLLPDVEVLLSIMVKTSRCCIKLLLVLLNFYSWFFSSWIWFNFRVSTKFLNFNQISQLQPNFWISTKFRNFKKKSEFPPKYPSPQLKPIQNPQWNPWLRLVDFQFFFQNPNLRSRLWDQIFQSPSPASSLYTKILNYDQISDFFPISKFWMNFSWLYLHKSKDNLASCFTFWMLPR